MDPQDLPTDPHRPYEDVMAMLVGTLFVALGVAFYTQALLLTGSTAGMAFLLQYASGWRFGVWFFLINLPFYYLAVKRMGWSFTLRTFVAIALVSLFSELTGQWVAFDSLNPLYASLMGGSLIGIGMLVLFRHRTSLGGINILALYLQGRYGLRAGYVQLGIDGLIMLAAFLVLPPERVWLSVLGAVALNLIIALNHKPGRYMGVS
ncbi:YitT family protein [Halomonas sp. MCCC 1A17488]|uniref:YitT family protein n=1 Tax=Billgrantia sulfidoxydans TaxID=2733484 RepID=A0ABX7W1P0_9GAMM|nr:MULTISPECIES: YitT family protein [Halomonas]MCE8016796.1 YitT family protein [Halomonas sp. MCCC 1A17488]MCG3240129.1 YitT family protein [Halomonas sp. MCCC 1A17488]QPP49990.1 YitT family protein [Halomonas sp. SS10-MC5]QTP53602.1 YitT family protein [Halomonas sulfidoxydans]